MARNLPASVKQQLLNLSRARGWDFNLLLVRYANERLLYRISQSPYADRLVPKGAFLFIYWEGTTHRPTRDIDLLGYGIEDVTAMTQAFCDICQTRVVDDGLRFDADSIRVTPIQEGQTQHGYRVQIIAYLGKGRIPVQVDVGAGDVVTPGPETIEFPTLLDAFPAPRLKAYPQEVTIAEKTHAMIDKGLKNSRMKDFYDLWVLSQRFAFDGLRLTAALRNTFAAKGMSVPASILPLSSAFAADEEKRKQWRTFITRDELDAPPWS
jgi:predicted nucleotidyltransferase component of viral defense system